MPHRTPAVQTETRTRRDEKETVGVQTDPSPLLPKGIRCPGTRVVSRLGSTGRKTGGTSDGPRPGGTSRRKDARSGPKIFPEVKFDVIDSWMPQISRDEANMRKQDQIFAVAATMGTE